MIPARTSRPDTRRRRRTTVRCSRPRLDGPGHRSRVRRVRHRPAAPPLPRRRARRGPRDRSPTSGSPAPPPRVPPSWRGASPRAATRSSSRRRPRSPNGCCGRRARRSRAGSRTPASCASRTRASTGRPTRRSTARRSPRSSSRPHDFRRFRMSQLAGPAAQNKGMALFPRRIGGRYVALSRWDRENNSIATSADGVWWGDARTLQTPSRPWELLQIGQLRVARRDRSGLDRPHARGRADARVLHRRPAARPGRSEPGHRRAARPAPGARRGRARRLRPQRRLLLRRAAARRPVAAALRGERRVGPVRLRRRCRCSSSG